MQLDELPPFIFFWTINKLLRMLYSVKEMKVTMQCFICLSGHLTYICMLPQASSHQIHAARFSGQYETSRSGVQKCGRALRPRDQKCGVAACY